MFKNLLRVAVRNLVKDKSHTLLNLLGLTIGITFSLFLLFYVVDELNYDRHHAKADRIMRIFTHVQEPERTDHVAITPFPLAPALKKDYPEVEHAVRLVGNGPVLLRHGGREFYEERIYHTDSNYLQVFTHPMLEGDARTALNAPNSIVLTQELAEKYFAASRGVVGKSLESANGQVFKVTGVIGNVPSRSHLRFRALISVSTLGRDFSNTWGNFGFYTYVLLAPGTRAAAFEKKLAPLYDTYMASIFKPFNVRMAYGVQPITDIHLRSTLGQEPEDLGNMSYIYVFSLVAVFMLLIASINYMNLTTARSARRAREIGIRKVAGSSQRQLVAQFLLESVVLVLGAFVLSLACIYLLMPVFNTLSGKVFAFGELFRPGTFAALLGLVLAVGLAGGSYPAFYLASFNPVAVLKGSLAKGSSNVVLRRSLVVVQFTLSITMLICTWIVYDQLQFLRKKDLGYQKDQVVVVNLNPQGDVRSKLQRLVHDLRQHPGVASAATSGAVPGADVSRQLFEIEGKTGMTNYAADVYGIEPAYLGTLGIRLNTGRNFAPTDLADTLRRALVNQAMVRTMGWKQPLGKKIKFAGDTATNTMEVIGVVNDFHQRSLYNPIEPLVLVYRQNNNTLALTVRPQKLPATLAHIEKHVKAAFPEDPFRYRFLDQDFDSQFAADQRRGQIFTAFSTLTIVIACLGLLGLVAFTTQQRQKEISIRKVLGAGAGSLFLLINLDFLYLIGLSCLLAFPAAYFFMHEWLSGFPYRTPLKPSTFAVSAAVVLGVTLLTVSFHTLKAALANPVKSLRSE